MIPKKESIGEVLNGDRLANTLYELKFSVNKSNVVLCHKKLSRDEVANFRNAIINDFYFQMYYDDLPFWGFIGKVEDENWTLDGKRPMYFLFNHVQFDVLYNDNQVTEIRAFSDPNHAVDITEDVELDFEFTYSAFWNEEAPTQHKSRTARYSKASLLPLQQKIHWFSFINSIVIIVLLTGFFVMVLMQRLKNDLRK